jgi:hypothetical protein
MEFHSQRVALACFAGVLYPITILAGLYLLCNLIKKKSFRQLITMVVLIIIHMLCYSLSTL